MNSRPRQYYRRFPGIAARAVVPHVKRALFAALAVACASPLTTHAADVERAQTAPVKQQQQDELSPELMYRLLVADVALQRGQPALAARAYFEAAKESRSVVFAQRATEIALATRQQAIALQSARLWSELDPSAERPKQIATTIADDGVDTAAAESAPATMKSQLERILAEAEQKGPALGQALMQINALLTQHDRTETLKLIESLAAPYDKVPEAHFAVALAAYNTGMNDMRTSALAMKEVDRALALNPAWERAVVLKADIVARESPENAIAFLREFVEAHPNSRGASGTLAQLYVQAKRYREAGDVFDRLLAADPNSRELRLARAALAVQMKDWTRAEADFQALKRDDPDEDGAIALALAEVAEESGRLPEALERYRAVPDGERGWAARLRAATVLQKMNRREEALRYLADLPAVTIEQRVQVRQTEAQIHRESGDPAGALKVLDQALVEHPDQPDLLYDAAMVAEKLDKLEVAESRLRRVVELKPESAQAWNALGYTLVDRTSRHSEGLEYIQRALQLSPDDAFILDSMGWAHFRLGQLDDAERYLRRAIAGRPDAEIAAHLGEVLWAKGEHERAREVWQSQLKSAPDNPVLLETVRRLSR